MREDELDDGSPPPESALAAIGGGSASASGKRKQPDSATPDASGKKRRQRAATVVGEDGEEGQDLDVGPNGGAKHWTDEEKSRFFTWMLSSDVHWDAFRTRMNTVFREVRLPASQATYCGTDLPDALVLQCSNELFPGRKSYTALKSCYHRNLEVFKQVHAFQVFSANHLRQIHAENPNAAQPSVDTMLETARSAGLNVGNLNVKVIDRWYETGWYDLFKKRWDTGNCYLVTCYLNLHRYRYRIDPKTGLPAPYFGPSEPAEDGPSSVPHTIMGLHSTIDPQLMAGSQSADGPYSAASDGSQQTYVYSPPPSHTASSTASHSFQYLRSSSGISTRSQGIRGSPATPTPARSSSARTLPATHGQRRSPFPDAAPSASYEGEYATQALAQLTSVTGSLLEVCTSLKELLQQQVEESRARTELMRAEAGTTERGEKGGAARDRDKEISIEKVTFATEILKNGPQNEEIKKAAIECLTKYLMKDL